ncbi:hypothetical protein TNCV_2990391 [Trichonephila clavipes]|nr:hypothetical protein TNCV_2990391 [Trichonephila clavipes]
MGLLFCSNVGNPSGLQQNVIAVLCFIAHQVSRKLMHGQCPIGKDCWCYYQRALSCGKRPNKKYKGLSNEVLNMIKPTYLELCTKELLTKCPAWQNTKFKPVFKWRYMAESTRGSFRVPQKL